MKNITKYFIDTTKSSENTIIPFNDVTMEGMDSVKNFNRKRNRVKIKISRKNTTERVCNIIENSNDMIDKTPSPFTNKGNNVNENSNETPIKISSSQIKHKKLKNKDLEYLSLETNNIFDNKSKEQYNKSNFGNSSSKSKKYKKESNNEKGVNYNINLNSKFKNQKDIDFIDLVDIDSNNKDENNYEESNAFQILMSRNKPMQHISPTKLFSQNEELNVMKSEEYKEKLKRSKEKLIALADKRGYSKRKLEEIEEGKKIERIIQNRIKSFRLEEKKDNNATVLNQKQSPGSLLNYFSKTPVDVKHTNRSDVSTIVVKADVHMSEHSIKHNFHSSNTKHKMGPSKMNNLDLEFSQVDDISMIESENINISNNTMKCNQQEHDKHKWSLRIKLQTYENEKSLSGDSSDEKLFSPKSKAKSNTKNSKKSEIKNLYSEDLSSESKTKKGIKLKQKENFKSNIKVQDNECLKTKFDDKNQLIKLEKHKSISIENKNANNDISTSLRNINKVKSNQDCIIINNDNSKRKTSDKLAPLFIKRQKPDPETVAARRLFLKSDIKDKNSKSIDRKVNICNTLPFPVISHVTQLNNSGCNEMNSFNIPEKVCEQYVPILNIRNYKCIMDFSEKKLKPSKNINKPKVQEVLTEIENNCSDVRKMWDSILFTIKGHSNETASPKMGIKKNKQKEKGTMIEYKSKSQIENCCWIYKYRPKSTQEVVGNEEAAAKLKEWLTGWKATFSNEDVSSGDEFYSSDSNSSKINENNQVAVLLGPHGSGKTASVYAVAEEFGYTVLEVNASSRRTGKKLLKQLEEATKSHRIKKGKDASAYFNSVSDEIVAKKIPQNSLILLEDVDLIFEEDEGFISATYQLASNTKRPIVMTCRDVYPHLNKMAPQQNRIYFQNAFGNRVCALLELISLAETGYRLPYNYMTELLQTGDLRKAILQLQYLSLSGPVQILEQSINFKNSFWQNMRHYLYKPIIKVNGKRKYKKATNSKIINDNKTILGDIARKLDNIALLSSLIDIDDSALNLKELKMQPSLSLIENTNLYSVSNNICLEIAEWISKKIIFKDQFHECEQSQYHNNFALKIKLKKSINSALSQATPSLLDHKIISTDYLPSVRAICRAEETRAFLNNKRGNRFFHYLHSLKVPSISLKPNILAAACTIMHDQVDNDSIINADGII